MMLREAVEREGNLILLGGETTAPWLSGGGDVYPGSVPLHNGTLACVFVLGILILGCVCVYIWGYVGVSFSGTAPTSFGTVTLLVVKHVGEARVIAH